MDTKKSRSPKALRGLQKPLLGPEKGTIQIPLTRGKVAIIDRKDFYLVKDKKWYATSPKGDVFYAARGTTSAHKQHRMYTMHNVIMGMKFIDHKDGNGLNNSRSNLRPATNSENQANRKVNTGTRFKGVRKDKGRSRWKVSICCNGNKFYLGGFATIEEAARAYDAAAKKHFGIFARLNFPNGIN